MAMPPELGPFDLSNWTTLLQTGIIGLLGYLGRLTFQLTDRLARIEEQVEEQKDRVKSIDERCFSVLRQVGKHHGLE